MQLDASSNSNFLLDIIRRYSKQIHFFSSSNQELIIIIIEVWCDEWEGDQRYFLLYLYTESCKRIFIVVECERWNLISKLRYQGYNYWSLLLGMQIHILQVITWRKFTFIRVWEDHLIMRELVEYDTANSHNLVNFLFHNKMVSGLFVLVLNIPLLLYLTADKIKL